LTSYSLFKLPRPFHATQITLSPTTKGQGLFPHPSPHPKKPLLTSPRFRTHPPPYTKEVPTTVSSSLCKPTPFFNLHLSLNPYEWPPPQTLYLCILDTVVLSHLPTTSLLSLQLFPPELHLVTSDLHYFPLGLISPF